MEIHLKILIYFSKYQCFEMYPDIMAKTNILLWHEIALLQLKVRHTSRISMGAYQFSVMSVRP